MVLWASWTNSCQFCHGSYLEYLDVGQLEAYQAGKHLPHIISKSFMETFTVGLGGSGMTLAVVIIMAFVLKKKMYKDVGRLGSWCGVIQCQ